MTKLILGTLLVVAAYSAAADKAVKAADGVSRPVMVAVMEVGR